jgi:hypothetical protein
LISRSQHLGDHGSRDQEQDDSKPTEVDQAVVRKCDAAQERRDDRRDGEECAGAAAETIEDRLLLGDGAESLLVGQS